MRVLGGVVNVSKFLIILEVDMVTESPTVPWFIAFPVMFVRR